MNLHYYNRYIKFIESNRLDEFTDGELHHIIPRCMGGTDDPINLIQLTAREHFLAHYLLTKIYPSEHKLVYALLCMIRDPHSKRRYTSRVYEIAKKQFSKMQRVRQTENNMMWTESAKKKISERMKTNNPMTRFPEKNPFKGKSYVIGKKWYNDGIVNLYLNPEDHIPEGFVPGMVYKKRK